MTTTVPCCPKELIHVRATTGQARFGGDRLSASQAAAGEYGLPTIQAAAQYLRRLAHRCGGLHSVQYFLPEILPDMMRSIGGTLVLRDEGIIVARLEGEA